MLYVLLIKCFTSSGIKDIFVASAADVLAGGVPVLQLQCCEGYLTPHVIVAVRLTLALLTIISFLAYAVLRYSVLDSIPLKRSVNLKLNEP